jgi:diphthamide synthase (EF-2-diphthine--ammonia ligase)
MEEGYTIKEILNEMRKENRESFQTVNSHLGQLNGKVATHVQLIAELQKKNQDRDEVEQETKDRLRKTEDTLTKYAVYGSIGVFFAVLIAQYAFNKLFS